MRPRDCSAPPCSAVDRRNSAGFRRPGRCAGTPAVNTTGSVLWQEQAPATPADIEFASSATALRSFNDEIRMSNGFPRNDESTSPATSPAPGYLPEANFFETPSAGAQLLSAGPPGGPAVQDWDPNRHSLVT